MSGYGQAIATISASKAANRPQKIRKAKKVKLTLKQRIRNWLNSDDYEQDVPQIIETNRLSSEGMHMQIYKASGGFVVETRSYDRRKDENFNSIHVIRDDQDLGEALGKIIMMESLKK